MMKHSAVLFALLSILSACNSRFSTEKEVELSAVFGVKTDSPLVNSNRVDIRFANQHTWTNKPDEFINSGNADGWSGLFTFPPSGILTAAACQFPSLVGFTDVEISDDPNVVKTINLLKADVVEMQILEPRDDGYLQKEFGLMPNSKFQIDTDEITELCSVRFSHSPKVDFTPYFSVEDNNIRMKDTHLNKFESDLSNPSVDMTRVTIMGVANIDGERQGFKATAEIKVSKNY